MFWRKQTTLTEAPLRARLIVAAGIAMAVWAISSLDTFRAIDGLVYDGFVSLRASSRRKPCKVFLVEINDRRLAEDEDRLLKLLQELNQLGCKQMAFNFLPAATYERLYKEARKAGNVVFGRHLVPDPTAPGRNRLADLPPLAESVSWGVVCPPPAVGGVPRAQWSHVRVGDTVHPTVEVCIAARVLDKIPEFKDRQFLIDFCGAARSIPNVPAERVEDLIPELVKDKCVLIGLEPSLPETQLHTPTTGRDRTMSLLEYQGNALNTLLCQEIPKEISRHLLAALLLTFALLSGTVYFVCTTRASSWITAASFLFYICGSSAIFLLGATWIPPTGMLLTQSLLLLHSVHGGALHLASAMQRCISDVSSQLKDRYWPIQGCSKDPSWSLVANMINQTLDLNKLIFLEAPKNEKRLKEMLALHCSLDDIVERRRDFTRAPYSDAINLKGPIRVKKFLRSTSPEEEQYLAPLVFSGELLGFWAIGIEGPKAAAIPMFDKLLRDYTNRISELLHEAHKTTQRHTGHFSKGMVQTTYEDLSATLGLLQDRLGTLDVLINRLSSGIIVYDVFGRVLQINEAMLSLLRKENLTPFEMTALDLILALSDCDASTSRKLLRRVIVDDGEVSFPANLKSNVRSRFVIHLKPLLESTGKASGGHAGRTSPKRVLCELVDTTSVSLIYEMKAGLTDRMGLQLRSDLAAIDLSSQLLVRKGLSPEQRGHMAEVIQAKIGKSVQMLAECRQYTALDSSMDEADRFPVDPKPALAVARESLKTIAYQKGLTFHSKEPSFISYVFASTSKLEQALSAILRLVCDDATDSSTVMISVAEGDDVVAFDFSNMGFGIPNELLQEYLSGEHALASEQFQQVQQAARWIESWGGFFEARSGVGMGMHFTVHLVKFI